MYLIPNTLKFDKDVIVFIPVIETNNEYYIPYHSNPINLNEMFYPSTTEKNKALIEPCSNRYYMDESDDRLVYCYTTANITYYPNSTHLLKGIIKSGTRFWLRDNLLEICAESVYITDKIIHTYTNHCNFDSDLFIQESNFIDFFPQIYEMSPISIDKRFKVGDVLLSNRNIISPLEAKHKDIDFRDVEGIICGFKDNNKPICVSLKERIIKWPSDNVIEKSLNGEWTLPNTTQFLTLLFNLLYVNVSIYLLGHNLLCKEMYSLQQKMVKESGFYWLSENKGNFALCGEILKGDICKDEKNTQNFVRKFCVLNS